MHWLLGALLVLVFAIVFGMGLLAYAMYALVGVVLVSRFLANSWSGHLVARRELNRIRIKLDETVAVVTTLENRSWLPIPWLLVEDLLPRQALIHNPPRLQVTGRRLQLVSFRGRGKKTLLYQLKAHCRGYYQIGPLVAETGDVFGLYRRYRVLSNPSYLLVYPEMVRLEGFDIASRRPIGEVIMTHRLFEDPTRNAGVRTYQTGDPLNRIHWRASAATGELYSKVYEPSSVAGATLLLDFHSASFAPKDEPVRSELAITATASIAGALYEMDQQVGLITNGRDAAERARRNEWQQHVFHQREQALATGMSDASERFAPLIVPTRSGATQLMPILELLARVEKTDAMDFAQLVHETASQVPRSATIIAILSHVSPQAAVALGSLRRRGLAVTAIVNVYDEFDFAKNAAPLVAEQIEVRHLRDRTAIPNVCLKPVMR